MNKSTNYKRLKTDEFIDEIIVKQIPRLKTSGMSGDEWRTSARITMKRKGQTVFETQYLSMEIALAFLPGLFIEVCEMPPEDFYERWNKGTRNTECMQPGCSNQATHEFRIKHQYHDGVEQPEHEGFEYRVRFCAVHAERGDSDYNDRSENLELLSGDSKLIGQIPPDDISQAQAYYVDLTNDE